MDTKKGQEGAREAQLGPKMVQVGPRWSRKGARRAPRGARKVQERPMLAPRAAKNPTTAGCKSRISSDHPAPGLPTPTLLGG